MNKARTDREESRGKVRCEFARDNEGVRSAHSGAQSSVSVPETGVCANTGDDKSGVASESHGQNRVMDGVILQHELLDDCADVRLKRKQ